MKAGVIITLLVLGLCACGRESINPAPAELSFRFSPSFRDGTLIVIKRSYGGRIMCSVQVGPEEVPEGARGPIASFWRVVKELAVTTRDFEILADRFEDDSIERAAELMGPGGMDGTSWTFCKQVGGRTVTYVFWSPESFPSEASSSAIALGRRFAVIAQLEEWFESEIKQPNQSVDPTAASGRGSP